MLAEPDLEMYLADMDEPPCPLIDDDVDEMSYAAARAFAAMVDNRATVEDLQAYRAWMTYCRMTHMTEAEMAGAIAVEQDCARKLGVA